jgi:hypothetical protein
MGFGVSLALIGVGAVLAFAVKWEVPGIDLRMIGWIFLAMGAVSMTLTALFTRRRGLGDGVETAGPDRPYVRNDPRAAGHDQPPSPGYPDEPTRVPPRVYHDDR